jgi:uncharacterized damage-inducible protein DinB
MSKEYFKEIANYNIWANQIVMNWLQQISEEQWNREINSSFSSIALTCIHIAGAEKIWYERFINKENPVFLFNEFNGSKTDLIKIWTEQSNNLLQCISNLETVNVYGHFNFNRLNGEVNEMIYWQGFAHVFNHSTYHRGQLVTMLRQVGFLGVSTTDYLAYTRRNL